MNRREAVQHIALLLGGTVVGGQAFILGCKSETAKEQNFTANDIAYLNEIADTILPDTKTPGAKAANVGQFMTVMVNDCYEESDQKVFCDGMNKLNDLAEKTYSTSFVKLTPQQRHDLLVPLDKEARDNQKKVDDFNKAEDTRERDAIQGGNIKYVRQHMSPHYFFMMKQLTMLGYFTSKIGMTQALRYEPVPGRYDGCVPYKKGDKAWA